MLFKNILVPYDLSKHSTHAFKIALDISQKYDSKITILTCVEGDPWHHKYYDSRADNELLKNQKKAAESHIQNLVELASKKGVLSKSRIIQTNSVVNTIVEFVKSNKIDLIVMGSHGRTGFDKIMLGSVANGVCQKAKCPVLIVK